MVTSAINTVDKPDGLYELLLKIALRYINVPLTEAHSTINLTLAEMGQFVNADRVYIFDYDFDAEDRPCVYPEQSYAKHVFPNNKNFGNLYGSESNAGGQPNDDFQNVACTNYLG